MTGGAEAMALATHIARSMSSAERHDLGDEPHLVGPLGATCAHGRPSSTRRMVSPNGSFCRRCIDSKPATIP